MSIKLADTLVPMADFPSAYAKDIAFNDGDTLQEKLDTGSLGGGVGYKQLSQAEYDALTDDEKMDGREYRTYDTGHIYKLGVEYGKDGVQIDDVNDPSETSVWSSKKTSDEIADIEDALKDKADKTELDGSKKLYITNTGANIKFVKIASAPTNGSSIDIHFKSARTNTTFEEETVRVSAYVSKTIYDGKIIQKGLYAANGNKPNENEANFLVILDDYSVWAHIASYSTAEIELYSYGRNQSIDGTEATTLPSEVKYSMFNGAEIATMDKVALKHEQFNKKVTLTDSDWKYEKITFEKNYNNTPSVNVSCGDYLNTEFYSYWRCEAYVLNINNKGCIIRYRSSKASESDPLEINIITFVNGI